MATKAIADATETTNEDRDEGGTAADDAFGSELEGVIADALNEDEDEDDDDLDDDEDLDDDDEDDDDDDDDFDDDDDDDEDVDDDEGDEGEGQARDEQGKFAKADAAAGAAAAAAPKAGTAGAAGAAGAGGAAAADAKPAAGAAAAAAEPKWETYSVNVDKQPVAIEEAKISRVNGHVFIALPEKDFNRFNQRLSRGVVGEKLWRDLHNGLRELEARKSAPVAKTATEIEAQITLDMIKPHLAEIFDDKDIALLEARIDQAKGKEKEAFEAAEKVRMDKARETPWPDVQADAIAQQVTELIAGFPELQTLTPEDIEEIKQREFLPVRNGLVFKEGEQTFANTQYMFDRLKARADNRKATPAAPAASSAPAQAPAAAGNPVTTAAPVEGKTKAGKADRFNRGVDAGKTRTTSVKANRDTDRPRKRSTRNGEERPQRRKVRTARQERIRAEDNWRKTERAFLNSPGLDFGNDE